MNEISKEQQRRFKENLFREKYLPFAKGKRARRLLEEACLQVIKENGGSIFYRDLQAPLIEVISELYEGRKILTKAKSPFSRWLNHGYDENSKNWIGRKKTLEEVRSKIEDLALNQLTSLRRPQPLEFTISTIYEMLKQYNEFSERDNLLLKAKRVVKREDVLNRYRLMLELKNRSMGQTKINVEERMNIFNREYPPEIKLPEYINFDGGYKSAFGHASLAYTDTESAIRFLTTHISHKPLIGRNVIFLLE